MEKTYKYSKMIDRLIANAKRKWNKTRLVDETIEAEFYDKQHGWNEHLHSNLMQGTRDELLNYFLPIYQYQLFSMDIKGVADEVGRELGIDNAVIIDDLA